MRRVVLGKTGLEPYQLGFGGIPIQRVDEEHAIETVLHAVESGVDFIDTARMYTTSEERIGKALEKVIPGAVEKEIGIIAIKPFSGGVIDNPGIALKFALSHAQILVLAGVEHEELFDENWDVFQGTHELSDDERREIREIQNEYDKIFCRRCDYCQPCSEEIPIQLVLGIRSMVKRMGPSALKNPFFGEALKKAEDCSECGECMTRCPYELPIPDLIRENLNWAKEQQ